MPRSRDPRKAWLGGELDVFHRMLEFKSIGVKDAEGRELFEPQTLVTMFSQRVKPCRSETDLRCSSSRFEMSSTSQASSSKSAFATASPRSSPFAVRRGPRPQPARSSADRPRAAPRRAAVPGVRLEHDQDGRSIGVYATSPRSADDASTFEERTADVDAESGKLLRPGRPRLDDGVLRGSQRSSSRHDSGGSRRSCGA